MTAALAHPVLLSAIRLADDDPDNSGESKKSGPIGLVVIILLCVACYFLFKSLSKHLRAIREGTVAVSSPKPADAPGLDDPDGPVSSQLGAGDVATAKRTDQEPAPPT
jgi:hypothetical protein